MTRISSIGGGFSGYHTISRSLAAATGASEYFGSTMVFVQAAAPTGWTQVTTYNDYALRIVSGATGTGGSVNFSSVFSFRIFFSNDNFCCSSIIHRNIFPLN